MEVTRPACDVYDHNEYPRVAFDAIKAVEITVKCDGEVKFSEQKVLCRKARTRLYHGLDRLLKPPAKREKDSPRCLRRIIK